MICWSENQSHIFLSVINSLIHYLMDMNMNMKLWFISLIAFLCFYNYFCNKWKLYLLPIFFFFIIFFPAFGRYWAKWIFGLTMHVSVLLIKRPEKLHFWFLQLTYVCHQQGYSTLILTYLNKIYFLVQEWKQEAAGKQHIWATTWIMFKISY